MQVVPDCKGETLLRFVKKNIEDGSIIHSDSYKSYHSLKKYYICDTQKFNPSDKSDFLMWIHVMISNIKSNIAGTYHGLDNHYIQNYLDEFCYHFNSINSDVPVFDELLKRSTTKTYLRNSKLILSI